MWCGNNSGMERPIQEVFSEQQVCVIPAGTAADRLEYLGSYQNFIHIHTCHSAVKNDHSPCYIIRRVVLSVQPVG